MMNYQSPVDLIISEMNMQIDGEIFKAVQNVGVNVDRDELIKALQYDRNQYQKGYNDRDAEIVRCKDCKHGSEPILAYRKGCVWCERVNRHNSADWFCADGERKSD